MYVLVNLDINNIREFAHCSCILYKVKLSQVCGNYKEKIIVLSCLPFGLVKCRNLAIRAPPGLEPGTSSLRTDPTVELEGSPNSYIQKERFRVFNPVSIYDRHISKIVLSLQ